MLEGQFYSSLFLYAIFGVVLVFVLIRMAKHNPIDEGGKLKKWQWIFGCILAAFSLFYFIAGCVIISQAYCPPQMLRPPVTSYSIPRSPFTQQFWGFPTPEQRIAQYLICNVFIFGAVAAYLFCYKKSDSTGWAKFGKILVVILLCMFYNSSLNIQYLDFYGLFALILYALLVGILLYKTRKKTLEEVKPEEAETLSNEGSETVAVEMDAPETMVTVEEQPAEQDSVFCPYCGKNVSTDSVFCEHCGKKLL